MTMEHNRYFTGKPCPSGHIADRYKVSGSCTVCVSINNAKRRKQRYAEDAEYRSKVISAVVEYGKANPEGRRKRSNKSYSKNKETYRDRRNSQRNFRRIGTKLAMPPWMTAKEMAPIYKEARERGMTVDHIIPLSNPLVCGLHVPWNLQIISAFDNSVKGNKYVP